MAVYGKGWDAAPIEMADPIWETLAPGVERFRLPGNEPVRRIITGRKRIRVGALYSWKNQGHVVHESAGEERLGRLLEVHQSVTQFFGQPETLRISFDEAHGVVHYTTDFLVFMGNAELRIEYKRLCDIQPKKPEPGDERGLRRYAKAALARHRLRLVREAYERCNIAWDIWTDDDVGRMADSDVVDEIFANLGNPITAQDKTRLIETLTAGPGRTATMADCEAALSESEFPRGSILSCITERIIEIDLFDPIGPSTLVRLTGVQP